MKTYLIQYTANNNSNGFAVVNAKDVRLALNLFSNGVSYRPYGHSISTIKEINFVNASLGIIAEGVVLEASLTYGIPVTNLKAAYDIDPDIINSFNGTGRWLYNNGTGYFKLGLKGAMGDEYDMQFKYKTGGKYRSWGVFNQSAYYPTNMSLTYGSKVAVRWDTNGQRIIDNLCETTSTTAHTLNINNGEITFDGVDKGKSAGHSDSFIFDYEMYLYTINPADTTPSAIMNGYFEHYYLKHNGVCILFLIPIKLTDGTYTMIDLITMTYPTQVGTFTIE